MPEVRTPADSGVEATHAVLPPDTNAHGTAFGGRIMEWMDIAAGICAGRHCRRPVVTVSVDELHFAHAVRMGDIVSIRARVNFTGTTSMEVGVRVEAEAPLTGDRTHALSGYFTFVAVDGNGRPVKVPPISPSTDEDRRRFDKGKERRARRLAQRPR